MINIQPYTTTDARLTAVQMDVKTVNPTDVSIDVFWTLYDVAGGTVDEGSYQLADSDYTAWQADNSYAQSYVMAQKDITAVENI